MTQRCYTVIVLLLNFITRCLTTSWDENNCPHDAMETVGGGSRRTITLPHLRTIHSACPSLTASSPVCQRRLHPLHWLKELPRPMSKVRNERAEVRGDTSPLPKTYTCTLGKLLFACLSNLLFSIVHILARHLSQPSRLCESADLTSTIT